LGRSGVESRHTGTFARSNTYCPAAVMSSEIKTVGWEVTHDQLFPLCKCKGSEAWVD